MILYKKSAWNAIVLHGNLMQRWHPVATSAYSLLPVYTPHPPIPTNTHQYLTKPIPTNTSLNQYPPILSPQPPTPDNILLCFALEVWVFQSLMVGSIVEQQEVAATIYQKPDSNTWRWLQILGARSPLRHWPWSMLFIRRWQHEVAATISQRWQRWHLSEEVAATISQLAPDYLGALS